MIEKLIVVFAEVRRWSLTIAVGAVLLALGGWWFEHNARVRQAAEAEILDRQATLTIQALKNQADIAMAANKESAAREMQARAELSARETAERLLRVRLASIEAAAQRDQERHAALSPAEVKQAVLGQIGAESEAKQGDSLLDLNEPGTRKVDGLLLELASCYEQDALNKELLQNCLQQRDALDVLDRERGKQLDGYRVALKAQQDLAGAQKAQLERQVVVARGGWLRRNWEKIDGPVLLVAGIIIGAGAAR